VAQIEKEPTAPSPQVNENDVTPKRQRRGGRLLFAAVVASYGFWLAHSFAVRTALSAIHQMWLKLHLPH